MKVGFTEQVLIYLHRHYLDIEGGYELHWSRLDTLIYLIYPVVLSCAKFSTPIAYGSHHGLRLMEVCQIFGLQCPLT